jgi:hypothetical protein
MLNQCVGKLFYSGGRMLPHILWTGGVNIVAELLVGPY